jgi:hypothetical protein
MVSSWLRLGGSSNCRCSSSLFVLLFYLSLHFIGAKAGLFSQCLFLHGHFGICSYSCPFSVQCISLAVCSTTLCSPLAVGLLLVAEMAGEIGASDGVFSKQKQFQAIHKLTHLKGPYDRVSSVIIPGILLATCFTLVVYHPILLWCIWCFLWSCPHSLTLLFVSVLD